MPHYRISEVAALLGVSDDTVRRWIDAGRVRAVPDQHGRMAVAGTDLAEFAQRQAEQRPQPGATKRAHNRFIGIVTRVLVDGIMAQVELQAGPFRITSVMTRESAEELGLEPGMLAEAVIKATQVHVEHPRERH